MPKETRAAQFMFRLQPTVKKAAEKAAAVENRSLSSLMETVLIEWLRERGYLPKGDAS